MVAFTYTNKLMDDCLQELEAYLNDDKPKFKGDIIRLNQFILSDIITHQGCYLLTYAMPAGLKVEPQKEFVPDEYFPDRTGYECYENHVHTQDILRSSKPGIHHLATGISLAEILCLKLLARYPDIKFHIIVSFPVRPIVLDNVKPTYIASASSSPLEGDTAVRNDCTVRFHAVRENEIIYDDLEAFRFEAMSVIET